MLYEVITLIAKIGGYLTQGFGSGFGTDEVHLDPGDAVLRFQHVRYISYNFV